MTASSMIKTKFRADHVGSLIRPAALLEARRKFEAGEIDADELHRVEDEQIERAVRQQQRARINILTDGEFRRTDFRTGLADAFEGFTVTESEKPWHGPDGDVMLKTKQLKVTGELKQKRRIAEGEATFLQSVTQDPIKVTLLAPGFAQDRFFEPGVTDKLYDRDEFAAKWAEIVRAEIAALFEEGVQYVQLDNPGYSAFLDEATIERYKAQGLDPDREFQRMLDTDIAAIKDLERHDWTQIGMHVCRGNQNSLWLAEGDYEPIAERLFGTLPVDRFLVEYDDERAGSFEPLRFIPDGVMAILGIVSSKNPEVEDLDELVARMDEAAKYVSEDYLGVSPQCGFASVAEGGNQMTEEQQWAKLSRVADVKFSLWGFEL